MARRKQVVLFREKEGLALLSMGQPPGRLVLRDKFAGEYAALDARLEGLAVHETRVGAFAPAEGD
jgi:hypothetical protein